MLGAHRHPGGPCRVLDAPMASGIARISIAAVAAVGFVLVLHLATHGYERAVMLIPTWFLLAVWVTAAGFTVTGQFQRDLVAPALLGGLVLIVLLIGFTVIQHAFAGGALSQGLGLRHRAAGIGALGLRRPRLRLGRQRRTRSLVSPQTRVPCSGCRAAHSKAPPRAGSSTCMSPTRDRYRVTLDAVLEQRRGQAQPRPAPARGERRLSLVQPQGAAGDRLGRRGHPRHRNAVGRHRAARRRRSACCMTPSTTT